jgi:hypothetical protein
VAEVTVTHWTLLIAVQAPPHCPSVTLSESDPPEAGEFTDWGERDGDRIVFVTDSELFAGTGSGVREDTTAESITDEPPTAVVQLTDAVTKIVAEAPDANELSLATMLLPDC